MKIYVAGRTSMVTQVRELQWMLTENGHEITFDWTTFIRPGNETPSDKAIQQINAARDRDGVLQADVLVALMGYQMCGTLIEIGIALGHNIPVILIGTPERDSVFFELDEVTRFMSDEHLIEVLSEVSRELAS